MRNFKKTDFSEYEKSLRIRLLNGQSQEVVSSVSKTEWALHTVKDWGATIGVCVVL